VNQAVGEAPTAAQQLDVKRIELQQATAALEAAELAYDIPRTVALQNTVEVLGRFVEKLTAAAAVEASQAAQAEAVELRARLAQEYVAALTGLAPDLDAARKVIRVAAADAHGCATRWVTAARLRYEIGVTEMRFGLGQISLEALPTSPVAALTEMFGDVIEHAARMSVRQPLPTYSSAASDSPEQIAANKMVAAHRDVTVLGKALKLSKGLLALFAKAGEPPRLRVPPSDPAVIGTSPPRPSVQSPGAVQTALGPTHPSPIPETAAEQVESARVKRSNTQRQAAALRELGEEARRQALEDELVRPGQRKNPGAGMRR